MTTIATAPAATDWHQQNQQYLLAALARVRAALARYANWEDEFEDETAIDVQLAALRDQMASPPALDVLCATFELSPFERDLLLLSAGPELDGSFAALCATVQDNIARPTFGLALAALPDAHWSAVTPDGPLRRWRLIELGPGPSLMAGPLGIDERVLHYLAGAPHLDEHLAGFVRAEDPGAGMVPSHQALAETIARTWRRADSTGLLPIIHLRGTRRTGAVLVAATAAELLGLRLYVMAVHALPTTPHELEALTRLWEREAALSGSALLLDCSAIESSDPVRAQALAHFLEGVGGALFIVGEEARVVVERPVAAFDLPKPQPAEQRVLWHEALGGEAGRLNGTVERMVAQFDLAAPAIRAAATQALNGADARSVSVRLWDACRLQSRPRLADLAQRIEPVASWDDLVLPVAQLRTLQEIAAHVRQRARVYDEWGFAAKSARGLGISALFAGPSGTGKTMAAEVLATELALDLYHIDLSQVVSKYIGETEKNLRRVFDAAEEGGAILFFDEADALFGKRSEVRDSHDRYANIEVSYLLQRMEAYRGLAILTTNMKKALDGAFMRRIRFAVQFPFPDVGARAEIWQRIFPTATPTAGLDPEKLARLNVAGGNIRNIALNAAFLAADGDEPVSMAHLLQAARSEYAKLEKPLTDAEIGGWL